MAPGHCQGWHHAGWLLAVLDTLSPSHHLVAHCCTSLPVVLGAELKLL